MSFNKAILFSILFLAVFVTAPLTTFAGPLIVETQKMTDIKENTANANGHIATGDKICFFSYCWNILEVDEYGIYWNTTGDLDTDIDEKSERGDADLPLEFSITMKDLQPGTTYYVWAYADHRTLSPIYGSPVSFTTLQRPEVSTLAVTDIGSTFATGNGTLDVVGIPGPIQHGVCWDTKNNPTIDDEKTEEGVPTAIGPFTAKITGLKTNKKYYVRAYAINAVRTVYGKQVFFKTESGIPVATTQAATNITTASATANATLVDVGNPTATQYGVCWAISSMPVYNAENCIDKDQDAVDGSYKVEITGLESGTVYYLRAFASNEADVYHYGEEVTFTTLKRPEASTQPASSINTNEAVANGAIVDLGNGGPTTHGACWNTAGLPTVGDDYVDLGQVTVTGPFVAPLMDLLPGTTYFVRAFAANDAGTVYGEERSFVTIDEDSAPRATVANAPSPLTRQTSYQLKLAGKGVVAYRYSLDDGPWSEPIDTEVALSFDLTDEGPHWLHVLGKNETGIWQARQAATVVNWTLDTTPPKVELPNVPTGTIGPFTADILVQGHGVVAYRYRLDEGAWSTIYPAAAPLMLPKLQDGPHTLAAVGTDLAGNWQDKDISTEAAWEVDSHVPTALLTNLPNAVTNETSIAIKVTAPVGSVAVEEYYYNFIDSSRWFHGDGREPIVVNGLPEGEYTLCVNAGNGHGVWQDGSAGTSSVDSATCYTWRIDLTPTDPLQLFTEEAPPLFVQEGLSIASRSIKLQWAWQSDDQLEVVQRYRVWQAEKELTENNLDEAVELFCKLQPGPQGYVESFVVRDLAVEKIHYFAVTAIDKAGNSSALSSVGPVTVVDQVPEITDMEFIEVGFQVDNASIKTMSLSGNNFINAADSNYIRFENNDTDFLFPATLAAAGKLEVQIPLGMPTDIYWVRVVNANGISAPGPEMITIVDAENPLPAVRDVSPRLAPIGSHVDLTIKGDHFEPSAGVNLVTQEGHEYQTVFDIVVQDSHTIFATVDVTDDFPEGMYNIQVTNTETKYNQFSAVRMELYVPQKLENASGGVETHKIVQLDDGIVPVVTTLKTRNEIITGTGGMHRLRINIFLTPGLTFEVPSSEQSESLPFHGHLLPPRETGASALIINTLGEEAIQLTMGTDVPLYLKNGATMFANMEITLPSHASSPKVYYIMPDGELELAGVQGIWQGIDIEKGGTVLSTRPGTPEAGQTIYTLGLLLDHFSAYAIGSTDPNSFSEFFQSDDAYGPCFIGIADEEAGIHLHSMALLTTAIGTLLLFPFLYLSRKGPDR